MENFLYKINTNQIYYYFTLLNRYANFGHIPIACIVIFNDNTYAITANTNIEHAEEILLKIYKYRKIEAIFVNLEPCIACAFKIFKHNIKYVFFSNYNIQYGGCISNNISNNSIIYGGLYISNKISEYFKLLRI